MKAIIISLFSIVVWISPLSAQEIKEIFIAMPDSITPLLSPNNKKDFIDFRESEMKAVIRNKLDSLSEMTVLTKDYFYIRMSTASTLEACLLPLPDSTYTICLINTYAGPAKESNIRFYNKEWKLLPTETFISLPQENDFYNPSIEEDKKEELKILRKAADIYLYAIKLNPQEKSLTINYTTPLYVDKETRKSLLPYLLKDDICYKWRLEKFLREENKLRIE